MSGTFDPAIHHRRSIRLKGCDYRQIGAYDVTICVQDRACLFGTIDGGAMQLNAAGVMIQSVCAELQEHYPGVQTDSFVIMPNHLHGIVILNHGRPWTNVARTDVPTTSASHSVGATPRGCPPTSAHDGDGSVGATPRGCPPTSAEDGDGPVGKPQGNHGGLPLRMSLSDVIHRFKSLTTARYRQSVIQKGWRPFRGKLWQRNYYEHVIRNDADLNRVRAYIVNNPAQWAEDENNPEHGWWAIVGPH